MARERRVRLKLAPPVGERSLRTLGVTGTDTSIGKTVVTAALAARARQLGIRVAAMKPVESGIGHRLKADGTVFRSDAERLIEAAGNGDPLSLVCPYTLDEALAPLVAAERAGVHIDVAKLNRARTDLTRDRELLLVEGAGGFLVPITRTLSFAQLFAHWKCELVLVAGNRMGVLNHVLLTMRAAAQDGLPVRAIVMTALTDGDASIAEATNYDVLQSLLPGQAIYRFPWVDRVDDPDALAVAAHGAGLDWLLLDRDRTASDPQSLIQD